MSFRAIFFSTRSRFLISVGTLALLLVGGGFAAGVYHPAAVNATSNGACGDPAVVAAFATAPVLDTSTLAQTLTIPAGEPTVVATVNGDQITAVELEAHVSFAFKGHQQALKQLPADAPADVVAELQKTPKQLRVDLLNKLINNHLFLQEAQRLGIAATLVEAQTEAQQQLQQFQNTPPADPAHISFQAYLCVNGLDTSTFLTNPLVSKGYQDALSIGAVTRHIITAMPQDQQNDPDAIRQAVATYTQQLRQAAQIQVFISLQ
jgi:hypothetical protein